MGINEFIEELRNSDGYIKDIYMFGGCYKFHILLSKMYKNTTPYLSKERDHIITKYKKKYYDIMGEVYDVEGYVMLEMMSEIDRVEKWSFHKNNLIVLGECPNCEEPLTF
jgi:hypothetical protein